MTILVLCENGFRHYDGFSFSENLLPAGEKVHFVAKGGPWEGPALQKSKKKSWRKNSEKL